MARAYVYMKVSEYLPPNPLGLRPLPLPNAAFLLTFLFFEIMKLWNKYLTQLTKDILSVSCRSSAFCDCSTNVLSVAYTVHIRFTRYTSVTHTVKSVSWPFFVIYLSITYALLVRFMRSFHVPRRPSSPSRRHSSPDEHRINIFCIFSVHSASVTLIR